jgi:hypothetical protein
MQTSILFVSLIFIAVIGASTGREYRQWARPVKQLYPNPSNFNTASTQRVVCQTTDTHVIACPSGQTCCLVASGGYGCCPVMNAVCCSDGINCCPAGYTCRISTGECVRSRSAAKLSQTVQAERND